MHETNGEVDVKELECPDLKIPSKQEQRLLRLSSSNLMGERMIKPAVQQPTSLLELPF